MSKKAKQPKKLTKQQEFLLLFTPKQIDLAAKTAFQYLLRRERVEDPEGSFDKKGRWYPSEEERCACCASVRAPSNAYPYSYMKHARSLEHCAWLAVKEGPKDFTALVRKAAHVAPPLPKTQVRYSEQGTRIVGATRDAINAWVPVVHIDLEAWRKDTHGARKAALRKKKAIEKAEAEACAKLARPACEAFKEEVEAVIWDN